MLSKCSKRQWDYLLVLAGRVLGRPARWGTDIEAAVGHLTQREKRGEMTPSEASHYIDMLKRRLDS
jgi:hypothetical protein